MLFSTPGGGLFSRAPPFMKTLGIHVHRLQPGGSSFVKSTPETYPPDRTGPTSQRPWNGPPVWRWDLL